MGNTLNFIEKSVIFRIAYLLGDFELRDIIIDYDSVSRVRDSFQL